MTAWLHFGRWKPAKHFLAGVPAIDGAVSARSWAARRRWSRLSSRCGTGAAKLRFFQLPLAGKYFLAKMRGARLFVVENKGKPWAIGDGTAKKRAAGELWPRAEGGLSHLVEKHDNQRRNMRAPSLAHLGTT